LEIWKILSNAKDKLVVLVDLGLFGSDTKDAVSKKTSSDEKSQKDIGYAELIRNGATFQELRDISKFNAKTPEQQKVLRERWLFLATIGFKPNLFKNLLDQGTDPDIKALRKYDSESRFPKLFDHVVKRGWGWGALYLLKKGATITGLTVTWHLLSIVKDKYIENPEKYSLIIHLISKLSRDAALDFIESEGREFARMLIKTGMQANLLEAVKTAFITRSNPKVKDFINQQWLLEAAACGREDLVWKSLEQKTDPNTKFYKGHCKVEKRSSGGKFSTPLHLAASNGHRQVVYYLLKYGASPNLIDSQSIWDNMGIGDTTPLGLAIPKAKGPNTRHHEIALLLLQHGASSTSKIYDAFPAIPREENWHVDSIRDDFTPLELVACRTKNKELLWSLLASGADLKKNKKEWASISNTLNKIYPKQYPGISEETYKTLDRARHMDFIKDRFHDLGSYHRQIPTLKTKSFKSKLKGVFRREDRSVQKLYPRISDLGQFLHKIGGIFKKYRDQGEEAVFRWWKNDAFLNEIKNMQKQHLKLLIKKGEDVKTTDSKENKSEHIKKKSTYVKKMREHLGGKNPMSARMLVVSYLRWNRYKELLERRKTQSARRTSNPKVRRSERYILGQLNEAIEQAENKPSQKAWNYALSKRLEKWGSKKEELKIRGNTTDDKRVAPQSPGTHRDFLFGKSSSPSKKKISKQAASANISTRPSR